MKLLLIEDNELQADALALFLGRKGHRMHHVQDGEHAMLRLARESYDAAVLDHYLESAGGGTGLDFLEELRTAEEMEDRPPLPVLVLTGAGGETARRLAEVCEALAPARLLRKPCPPEDVVAALEEMTGCSK